jgi:hypothetical protein
MEHTVWRSRRDGNRSLSQNVWWGQTWWSQTVSNRRPPACKAGALPAELWPRSGVGCQVPGVKRRRGTLCPLPALHLTPDTWHLVVGLGRFELPTSRLSSARSNQLSYRPCQVSGVRTQMSGGAERHPHLTPDLPCTRYLTPDTWHLVAFCEERETKTAGHPAL